MTTMVERVACAIYTENAAAATGRLPWAKAHEATKANMRKLARAALEEIRVPTPKMVLAGNKAMPDGIVYSLEPGEGVDDYDGRPAFTAMIDAALKETP